jgi:hypothetical protein
MSRAQSVVVPVSFEDRDDLLDDRGRLGGARGFAARQSQELLLDQRASGGALVMRGRRGTGRVREHSIRLGEPDRFRQRGPEIGK